jgi:hypothetical protein
MLFAGFLSLLGLVGFVSFHDSDDQDLRADFEVLFFASAAIFLILSDFLLRILQNRTRCLFWSYDVILIFFVLSFIGLRVLTMVVTLEEAISLTSVLEYLLYGVIFVKFPILGWELYGGYPVRTKKVD